jgi:ABC-type Mn2+/Zn2+ transport system ATPase subunit
VRGAAVGWGRNTVLRDVELSVSRGTFLGLVGPNGAGKSTLLQSVLGLARPLSGSVERLPGWRAGYVPQRENVEPLLRLRAEEVVAMAAVPSAWAPFSATARRRATARDALAAVGMERLGRHVFRDLSGGQRQRVVLARALAADPTVLVLDEPTTGLDLRAEREILDLLVRLLEERDLACILVTHDLDAIAGAVRDVGLIHGGRLRIGKAEEMLSAATLTSIYGAGIRLPHLPGECDR